MSIKLNQYSDEFEIGFRLDTYKYGGGLAIEMLCDDYYGWSPYAMLTVNLEDYPGSDNIAFVDTNNLGSSIVDWITNNNLGEPTGNYGFSGWCAYPEVRFDLDKIKEHEVE